MNTTKLGIDLVKNIFQLHGVDKNGCVRLENSGIIRYLRGKRRPQNLSIPISITSASKEAGF